MLWQVLLGVLPETQRTGILMKNSKSTVQPSSMRDVALTTRSTSPVSKECLTAAKLP